jgi:hypothetical protein
MITKPASRAAPASAGNSRASDRRSAQKATAAASAADPDSAATTAACTLRRCACQPSICATHRPAAVSADCRSSCLSIARPAIATDIAIQNSLSVRRRSGGNRPARAVVAARAAATP